MVLPCFHAVGCHRHGRGSALDQYQPLITRVGGLAVIVFGLNMAGVVKIPWLYRTVQSDVRGVPRRGLLERPLWARTFAAGWVPCVGPFLASILALASQERTAEQGMALLFTYAIGLGLPFRSCGISLGPRSPRNQANSAGWEPSDSQRRPFIILGAAGNRSVLISCGRLTELFGIGLAL